MTPLGLLLLLLLSMPAEIFCSTTAQFRVLDLRIVWLDGGTSCSQSGKDCPVDLRFCAGVRFSRLPHYHDCHYLHHKMDVEGTVEGRNISIPVLVRWPTTPWHLTISGLHDDTTAFELSTVYENTHSGSGLVPVNMSNNNVSVSFYFQIDCEQYLYGPSCTTYCNEQLRDPSGGSFSCSSSGEKLCSPGWEGEACNRPVCSQGCVYGECIGPNTCSCELGWRGSSCDDCVPLQGCQHGYCQKAHQCICHEHWTGTLCNRELDFCRLHPDVCQNGGSCSSGGKLEQYYCNCTKGFEGANCELKVDRKNISSCDFVSCVTGSCVRDPYPRCECPRGHYGELCQFNDTPSHIAGLFAILGVFFGLSFSLIFTCLFCYCIKKVFRSTRHSRSMEAVYTAKFMATDSLVEAKSTRLCGPRSRSPPPSYSMLEERDYDQRSKVIKDPESSAKSTNSTVVEIELQSSNL